MRQAFIFAASLIALDALTGGASAVGAQKGRAAEPTFRGDIEELAEQNDAFRRVLYTGDNVQVVVMSLRKGEDIGAEVHEVDQCFAFIDGEGETVVGGKTIPVSEDDVVCVPGGTRHNIRNAGSEPLKLYTIYAPPQHPAGTIHETKADAERAESKGGHKH